MTKLFAKLIGVKSSSVQPNVQVYCLTDYQCTTTDYSATYYNIGGVPKFQHCGC